MPDLIFQIETPETATSVIATVALTRAQADAATFGAVIEISPDGGTTWFFAASSSFAGSAGWTSRDGSTNWQLSAASPSLPAPPTHARVRLTDPSDPTLVASLEVS